ncbi:serine/threonine protein kinase [Streptomyces sp. NPDC015130]|uniref:serine/threonine protein kinase n=1 Tax=Streptomyces sp. NPDC015130 TaxID=3364940 RepID=UPI0036F5E682
MERSRTQGESGATPAAPRTAPDRPSAQDRRVGPYRLVTRLDPPGTAVPCRRFVARTPDGDRTVLLSTPLPGTDPARFAAEATAGRYLLGPWIAPVTDVSEPAGPAGPPGLTGQAGAPGATGPSGPTTGPTTGPSGPTTGPAWYASPYVPALPLPVALAVHGGPLPEATVRAVGAALAEALAAAHSQGITHAGVSPAAVLLTADGPRLSCFGAVRAAAADGEPRTGLPGLDPGALAPEQAAGGRPRPPGDVFALGAVLAYAATGHTVPEREELPPALRPVVSSCLARDPADRPTAAALMTSLAPPTAHHTVLNSAGALLTPGWLPGRVIAALARQSAELLAAELPELPEQQGRAEHATPAHA